MGDISRVALFGKLDELAYKAVEGATVFCKLRGNPYVELVHWINQILQLQNSDLHCIVRAYGVDPSKLARDITDSLDRLPRGASSISDLSAHIHVGLGDLEIRRLQRPHRLCDRGHSQDAKLAKCVERHIEGIRQAESRTADR
jgi:ATP-dependent Clp protease ATP-binding subunit ClpA